ncbi:MAG: GTP cyclohydrolase I FolE [Chlamydiota bacterium]
MKESPLLTQEEFPSSEEDQLYTLAATTRFPSPLTSKHSTLSDEAKLTAIESKFREIMEILGLDLSDESLAETPYRVAKMYVQEIFAGLKEENFPTLSYLDQNMRHAPGGIIVVKDIQVNSFCEHHFLPICGTAQVAYRPREKLLGLSKINRIVDYFCRRPQIQERLNAQIADSLSLALNTPHVAVSINAKHFCVSSRGIHDNNSLTETQVLLGDFYDKPELQQCFQKID